MPPRGYRFSDEERRRITASRLATTRRNRMARRLAMSPEEREAAAAREREVYHRRSVEGWRTRRRNQGLPPGPAPRAVWVRMYADDLPRLRSLSPSSAVAVRKLLDIVERQTPGEGPQGPPQMRMA